MGKNLKDNHRIKENTAFVLMKICSHLLITCTLYQRLIQITNVRNYSDKLIL